MLRFKRSCKRVAKRVGLSDLLGGSLSEECILLSSRMLEIPGKSFLQICIEKLMRNRIIPIKPCLTHMTFLKRLYF